VRSPQVLEQLVQRLARPEGGIEIRRLAARMAEVDHLLDDDRPRPERGQYEYDHHQLHHDIGPRKEREQREIDLLRHRKGFSVHLPARPKGGRLSSGSD
jgi:hypothetical protein